MRAVGVRELKNRLSEYLRLVRAGERVLVTDRGQVIAELGIAVGRYSSSINHSPGSARRTAAIPSARTHNHVPASSRRTAPAPRTTSSVGPPGPAQNG